MHQDRRTTFLIDTADTAPRNDGAPHRRPRLLLLHEPAPQPHRARLMRALALAAAFMAGYALCAMLAP
jgi:hypothetical protein